MLRMFFGWGCQRYWRYKTTTTDSKATWFPGCSKPVVLQRFGNRGTEILKIADFWRFRPARLEFDEVQVS